MLRPRQLETCSYIDVIKIFSSKVICLLVLQNDYLVTDRRENIGEEGFLPN
jgi:hypothetical protein